MCIIVQIIDLVVLYRISYDFLYEGVCEVHKSAHEVGGGFDKVWQQWFNKWIIPHSQKMFLIDRQLSTPLEKLDVINANQSAM